MATPLIPLINGQSYDWANITISFLGSPMTQVTKLSYDTKQNKTDHYGAYNQPINRGYGNITYTGSIEMYVDTWRAICQAAPLGSPLNIPAFTISVQYGDFNQSNVLECRDILQNVEFMEDPRTMSQGETGLKVTIPLIIAGIQSFSL